MPNNLPCTTPRLQRGLTLIELSVALALTIVIGVGILSAVSTWTADMANEASAGHARTVAKAAQAYIDENRPALIAAASPTAAVTITPQQLRDSGHLPAGVSFSNAHGQSFVVQALEPAPGLLQAIVRTTGGERISGLNLRKIAQRIGVEGGFAEDVGASAVAYGAFGGWQLPLTNFGGNTETGRIVTALFVSDAATTDSYLHRTATAGRPDLNRMSTGIDMAGNNLNNAGTVYAATVRGALNHTGGRLNIGSLSPSYGTGSGALIWKQNTSELAVVDGANITANLALNNAMVNGELYAHTGIRTNGTLTANNSASIWNTLSVGSNLTTQGTITTAGGWRNTQFGGGWYMSDPSWIRAYNDRGVTTGGMLQGGQVMATGAVSAGTTVTSAGRLTAGEYLLPQGQGVCNAACPTNGLLGRQADGHPMSCVAGSWRCLNITTDNPGNPGNPGGPKAGCLPDYPPTGCPTGWSPMIGGCINTRTNQRMVCP